MRPWGILVLLAATLICGCADSYRMRRLSRDGALQVAVREDGAAEQLVVRVSNDQQQPLHVDWGGVVLRMPNGFDSPVETTPQRPLGLILPGGAVEYHIRPVHHYFGHDRLGHRRNSLETSVTSSALFEEYADNFRIILFVPVCRGGLSECIADSCESGCVHKIGDWSTVQFVGSLERL
jgi:hypothetical protein